MKIVLFLLCTSLCFAQTIESETMSFFCEHGSETKIVKVKKTSEKCLITATENGKKVILVNEASNFEECDKSVSKALKKLKKAKYACG